jgi:TatD DNase family protein
VPNLVDTHCHINFEEDFPNPSEVVSQAVNAGVVRIIAVGCDTLTSQRAVELSDQFTEVFAVVGWHPNYSARYDASELKEIERLLTHPKAVALGEIGLDYHWNFASKAEQERCLTEQLELAVTLDVPVVIHCRQAYDRLLEVLRQYDNLRLDFHCFSGEKHHLDEIREQGWYIGLDGPLTYPKSGELRKMVAAFPKGQVLVETDSPYLSPKSMRGRPNRPAYVVETAQMLAQVWQVPFAEAARITTENAETFFGLPALEGDLR